jgi:cell division protein FtsZ
MSETEETSVSRKRADSSGRRPDVVVVGIGGAGVNAIARLLDVGLESVTFVAADTSEQTLARAAGAVRVSLGSLTRGLGTGGNPERGREAAEAHRVGILQALDSADLVFVAAGLAGGTGGGGAPVVGRLAREMGAVVVGFGVTPFGFEAPRRAAAAEVARKALAAACDATVVLDNQRALEIAGDAVPLDVALRVADDVLRQAVQGLSELVTECGPINVDLAVVRDVLAEGGECCLALGIGRGATPAQSAMTGALESPLVDMQALVRAPAVLVQVTGDEDLSVHDTAAAVALLQARLAPECRLVVGTGVDTTLAGGCQVTILGTGLVRTARTLVEWSSPTSEWRRAAGLPPSGPPKRHRFDLTGAVAVGGGRPNPRAESTNDSPVRSPAAVGPNRSKDKQL